jgi:uncharacterized protein (TIGR02266 family)
MPPAKRQGSKERRRGQRVEFKIPVDYSAVDAFFTEFSANINEGGMFLETDHLVEPGSQVQLQFRLPGLAEPVVLTGRVARTSDGKDESPQGIGIEFQELDPDVSRTINEVVRSLKNTR